MRTGFFNVYHGTNKTCLMPVSHETDGTISTPAFPVEMVAHRRVVLVYRYRYYLYLHPTVRKRPHPLVPLSYPLRRPKR